MPMSLSSVDIPIGLRASSHAGNLHEATPSLFVRLTIERPRIERGRSNLE